MSLPAFSHFHPSILWRVQTLVEPRGEPDGRPPLWVASFDRERARAVAIVQIEAQTGVRYDPELIEVGPVFWGPTGVPLIQN